jgi:hypothetical protein
VFCHNPTAMAHEEDVKGYLSDLSQAGQHKLGRITAEVDNLVRHLSESVSAVGNKGYVIHIAHSQGALITFLAARRLEAHEMNRIEVIAFGGAVALRSTPETPFKRCINYYAVNDPILYLDPTASQALRSGFMGGTVLGDETSDEFCFLAPRDGDPAVDHSLDGPTYMQALKWEGEKYRQIYVSPGYKIGHSLCMYITAVGAVIITRLWEAGMLWCTFVWKRTSWIVESLFKFMNTRVWLPLITLWYLFCEALAVLSRACSGEEKYVPVSMAQKRQ